MFCRPHRTHHIHHAPELQASTSNQCTNSDTNAGTGICSHPKRTIPVSKAERTVVRGIQGSAGVYPAGSHCPRGWSPPPPPRGRPRKKQTNANQRYCTPQ